jgi:hypothetical protein
MINCANAKIKMTAEQILKEIEALPKTERERLVQCMRKSADIRQDFIDALDDFKKQRFVSMETALNGAIHLSEDPLAWQRRVRGEWE